MKEKDLQLFWNIKEVPRNLHLLAQDEQAVVDHFSQTHVHAAGRYKVTLQRKPDAPRLGVGDSRAQALQHYYANERLSGRESVQQVVQEYLDLGHAELRTRFSYYMPMHGAWRSERAESSSTTKLRVVFDASAKTSSGFPLNYTLMVGPTLYPNTFDILYIR